jgi:hypothetical protein
MEGERTVIIGIDPGLTGAVAVLGTTDVMVWDTPTVKLNGPRRARREYDLHQMRAVMVPWQRRGFAYIEATHAMPKQGVCSMWTMGYGVGVWEGLLAALEIPWARVRPQRWQREMLADTPKGKDASRLVAMRLFPQMADLLRRKQDHGRADALLIAAWGRRQAERAAMAEMAAVAHRAFVPAIFREMSHVQTIVESLLNVSHTSDAAQPAPPRVTAEAHPAGAPPERLDQGVSVEGAEGAAADTSGPLTSRRKLSHGSRSSVHRGGSPWP